LPRGARDSAREEKLVIENPQLLKVLCGRHDENLRKVEETAGVVISARGNVISIFGSATATSKAKRALEDLYKMLEAGRDISPADIFPATKLSEEGGGGIAELSRESIIIRGRNKTVSPKSPAQREYIKAMAENDLVFSIGPAGTGKTYLAMAMAVLSLQRRQVSRILLTRPAVEAGEKLGFLPGDMVEKVNPYLRPLYDALHDMMDFEQVSMYLEKGIIEVAPLAFMRGRTLNDAFIILDEAQNTTPAQMKMFLTRMGFDSKAVVTGDITQVDLPTGTPSGLIHARKILEGVAGIKFCYFSERDVVRHHLVQEILRAYEKDGV
jgi:phosphate starvation-inducible PhoH-like protein